jgi:prophage tail gpP-like protein
MIFSQVAGINLSKKLWAEGSVTFGNLQNYTDHNALYVYNSVDPTVFRTGASLYWYLHKNLTLYGNYLYDTKEVEQTSGQYIQHSFLTGIIWKL